MIELPALLALACAVAVTLLPCSIQPPPSDSNRKLILKQKTKTKTRLGPEEEDFEMYRMNSDMKSWCNGSSALGFNPLARSLKRSLHGCWLRLFFFLELELD
jgi:hypothetical protein